MFNSIAYAMGGAPGGASPGGAGGFASLVPLILMFVIFYFLLIRPQQKKAKEHRNMLDALKKGDRIMTNGGIHGSIISLDEQTISLEIAEKVRVKIGRGYVADLVHPAGGKALAEKEKKSK